jgi:hypothetical protein
MSDLQALERRIAAPEAPQEIRHLQHKYGYDPDDCHYREIATYFHDEGEAHPRPVTGQKWDLAAGKAS